MKRQFWSWQARDDHTDLYILTEIAAEESWWSDVTTPQMFRRQLMGVSGEIHIWLDSPGGDAFAGAAMYDMLREYSSSGRGKTVAMVSLAASAASLIAMACDEIRISVVGTIMIHEPWSLTAGNERELLATAKTLATIRDGQIDAYARRSGQSREKVLELMQGADGNGTYMNAAMALELGFADRMIDEAEGDGSVAASLNRARVMSAVRDYGKVPEALIQAQAEGAEAPEDGGSRDEEGEPQDTAAIRSEMMKTIARSY